MSCCVAALLLTALFLFLLLNLNIFTRKDDDLVLYNVYHNRFRRIIKLRTGKALDFTVRGVSFRIHSLPKHGQNKEIMKTFSFIVLTLDFRF